MIQNKEKMENNFNFKSQICTSREQSERLLALGLKKETADCYWWQENDQYGDSNGKWHLEVLDTKEAREHFEYLDKIFDDDLFIPAWSLWRLLALVNGEGWRAEITLRDEKYGIHYGYDTCGYNDIFEAVIAWIEADIMEDYFNKEYLV